MPAVRRCFALIYGVNRWLCYRIMTVALSPETLRQRRWVLKWAILVQTKDLFRRCGVVCFSSNYELYADMSNRVMSTLEELSPRVEIYSIDEAFCDLTGVRNCRDLTDFGREIRATVLQRTHLTVGVGIAQTKTLAKLANHAAKKWQRQTGGVVDLSNLERQRKLMSALSVDDVWGLDGGSAKTGRDGDQNRSRFGGYRYPVYP